MIDACARHNDGLRKEIPEAAGDVGPICERLRLRIPSEPFPVTNTTDEYREMIDMPPLRNTTLRVVNTTRRAVSHIAPQNNAIRLSLIACAPGR